VLGLIVKTRPSLDLPSRTLDEKRQKAGTLELSGILVVASLVASPALCRSL